MEQDQKRAGEYIQSNGVVLKSSLYGDYDRITFLYTKEDGVIKLLVKGAFSSKMGKGASTEPLVQGEFTYRPGIGDLYFCKEIAVTDFRYSLRGSFAGLEAACDMAQIVRKTQLQGKGCQVLYTLFTRYLDKIPSFRNPRVLTASFFLKLLRHEGLFCLEQAVRVTEFDEQEKEILLILAYSRSFEPLNQLEVPLSTIEKIRKLVSLAELLP